MIDKDLLLWKIKLQQYPLGKKIGLIQWHYVIFKNLKTDNNILDNYYLSYIRMLIRARPDLEVTCLRYQPVVDEFLRLFGKAEEEVSANLQLVDVLHSLMNLELNK